MENTIQVGMNRTGIKIAPDRADEMAEFALEKPETLTTPDALRSIRLEYARESGAVGSLPAEAEIPALLLDKIGERLAFERSGARLYEALLLKCEASGREDLPVDELVQIHEDEKEHFNMLNEVLRDLGADPTAQTPCADVTGVASMGWVQVLNDPRTDILQALDTILIAELTDKASWEMLIELAQKAGLDEEAERFTGALEAEARHLETIKTLLRELSQKTMSEGASLLA